MYIRPPADGILDLDVLAEPPTGIVLQALIKISVARSFPVPRWVRGVRIHTSTNTMEKMLSGEPAPGKDLGAGEGYPLPWPFPWWAPEAREL